MKASKFIFILALAVLFVGTTFATIFGAGRALGEVFKDYVLKYEVCDYRYQPMEKPEVPTENCAVDKNESKKDIAEGLAMFIVSLPVAIITYKELKRSNDKTTKK